MNKGRGVAFLLFILLVPFQGVYSQSIYTCGQASLSGDDVLDKASPSPSGQDLTNGSWTTTAGLTFSNTNISDSDISNFIVGNTYTVKWTANISGNEFTVDIIAVSAPSVTSLTANAPPVTTLCNNVPASPNLDIDLANGTASYTVRIETTDVPTSGISTRDVVMAGTSTTVTMNSISSSTDYNIINVEDANGCTASGLPVGPVSYTVFNPAIQNVSGTDECFGSTATIGLDNSENGITYELRRGASVIDTHGGTGAAFSFANQTAVGTYEVYATDGTCDVQMSGSVDILNTPSVFTASFIQGTPYCSGNSYNVSLSGSEVGVDYTLYRDGASVVTLSGTGSSFNFSAQNLSGDYTVKASNGVCAVVSMTTNPNPLRILPSPTVYNVTGGTECADIGVTIGLSGGEASITYELFLDAVSQGTRIDNGDFGFKNSVGTYTIEASAGNGCSVSMGSQAVVNPMPAVVNFVTTGKICPTGEVALATSESGVRYELFRDGVSLGLTKDGDGNAITFGVQSTSGIYTVKATFIATGCNIMLTDQLEVQPQPTVYDLTANRTTYCSTAAVSGVDLTLSGTDNDNSISYQLYKNGIVQGGVRLGDGNPITITNVEEGTYTVKASNVGGCTLLMNYSPVITAAPAPTATIATQIPDRRCANVAGSFNVTITLTGTPPFDFDIEDDKGSPAIHILGHNTASYTQTVNPAATTTYSVTNLVDAASCLPQAGIGSATVYIDPAPVITFNPANPEVCKNNSVIITAYGAGVGGSYSWSDGLGNNQSINVAPAVTHTYTVTATTSLSCSENNSVTVTVNPLPVVDFNPPGNDYEYCQNNPNVTLTGAPAGGSFGGTGIVPSSDDFSPAVANIGNNAVTYTYQDANTCVNSIAKNIVVNSVPNVFIFGLGAEYCANDGLVTFSGSPTSATGVFEVDGQAASQGVWWDDNGDGTGWFDPAIATAAVGSGVYTFRYTYTDPNVCTASDQITVTLHPDLNATVTFTGMPAGGACQDDNTNYNLQGQLSGVNVASGVFTGPNPGLIDGGDDGTAVFNPFLAGNGTHSITFTYTDANGCTGSETQVVTIGTDLDIPGLKTDYCKDEAGFNIIGNQSPNGAVSLTNITTGVVTSGFDDPANPGQLVFFDPTVLVAGPYQIEYSFTDGSGCTNSQTWDVELHPMPDATFEYEKTGGGVEITQYCVSENAVTLTPTVVGGNFSGTAVSGSVFNPSIAGVGTHNITYTITQNGCTTVNTRNDMSVVALPTIDINNLDADYCDNEASFSVLASNSGTIGGLWDFTSTTNTAGLSPISNVDNAVGTADFDPAVGVGSYTVTMTYTDPAQGCENSVDKLVTIYETPEVNFGGANDLLKFCQDDASITLTASFNTTIAVGAGVFSGDGITDNGDGTAIFDPNGLTVGDHPITYEYTNPNHCVSTRIKTFRILDYPTPFTVTGGGDYCAVNSPTGLPVGLSDSEVLVDYELLLNGLSLSPAKIVPGTGSAITFGNQTAPGVYTVQAESSASNCSVMMTGSVTIKVNDVTLVVSTTDVLCNGGSTGSATVIASGGTANYTYEWENSSSVVVSNSATASNLVADTYQVTVSDAVGCPAVKTGIVINEPNNALVVNVINIKNVGGCGCTTGSGICEGSAEVKITGGTPNYITSWSTGGAAIIEDDIEPGNHSVTVTDNNGCVVTVPFTITQLSALTLVENLSKHVDVTCNGDNTGKLGVTAGGGSGSYEYSIDNSSWFSSRVFTGLKADDYDVWVRDANYPRCILQLANPITITEPASLTLTEVAGSHIDVDCNGASSGQLEVLSSGGSGSYKYSVDGGSAWQVSPIFSGLAAGTYNVWVRDANATGCKYTGLAPVIITQPTPMALSIASVTNVSCNGEADGAVSLSATGGSGSYVYSIDGGANWQASNTFNGLFAGSYDFSVKDASAVNCKLIDEVSKIITQPDDFNANVTYTDVSCFGGNNGTITVSLPAALTGRQIEFSVDGVNWYTVDTKLTGLTAQNYKISIRDVVSGCEKVDEYSVDITEPISSVVISSNTITDVKCNGDSDGAVVITVSGGTVAYSYSWTNSLGVAVPVANGGNTSNPSGLVADDYTVIVTDGNGCQTNATYTVAEPNALLVTESITHVTTYNGNDGVISVSPSGGTTPYTIDWDDITSGVESLVRNNLVADDYTYTLSDKNGCDYTNTVTVTQPNQLLFDVIGNDATCYGYSNGSISVSITSGTPNYSITLVGVDYDGNAVSVSAPANYPSATYTFVNIKAGTYTVKIIDANSEELEKVVTISHLAEIAVALSSSQNITCNSGNTGEIVVSISGRAIDEANSTINWTRNPAGWSVSGKVDDGTTDNKKQTGLIAGKYTINVTDEYGCIATPLVDVVLSEPAPMSASHSVNHVTSNGGSDGSITIDNIVSENGVKSIAWYKSSVLVGGQTGQSLNNISADIYYYIITDNNDCIYTSPNIPVTEPSVLSVAVTKNDINCYDANDGSVNVIISSGTAAYTVEFTGTPDDGSPFIPVTSNATNVTFDNLNPGSYHVKITDSATPNQVYEEDITIIQNPETILNGTVTDITCFGEQDGTVLMSLTGYTDGSEKWQVVDPNGITLYNGLLTGNDTQSAETKGTYTITVTNQDGCQISDTYMVSEPAIWNVSHTVTSVTPAGNNNGEINIDVLSGNTAPYSITWSDGLHADERHRTGLVAGTYWYHIEDATSNCVYDSGDILISEPNPLVVNVTPNDVVCYNGTNGSISIEFNSHNGGYYYQITGSLDDGTTFDSGVINPASENSVVDNLKAGTYAINAYDVLGTHYYEDNIIVEQPDELIATATVTDVSCYEAQDGAITISLSGRPVAEVAAYNMIWNGPSGFYKNGTYNLEGTQTLLENAGAYNVTVYDNNSCPLVIAPVLQRPNELVVNVVSVNDVKCNGGSDGEIKISVTGRPAGNGFTYDWENWDNNTSSWKPYQLAGNATLTNIPAGVYHVIVTSNSDACTVTSSDIIVSENGVLSLNTTVKDILTCNGDNSGEITVDVSGGVGPFTLNYGDPSDIRSGSGPFVITGLIAGDYTVTVTDANLCDITDVYNITQPAALVVDNIAHNINCRTDNTGTLTFNISGGAEKTAQHRYYLKLSAPGGISYTKYVDIADGNSYPASYTNLAAGEYTLEVQDVYSSTPVACAFTYSFKLEFISFEGTVTNTTCKGVNTGAVTGITLNGSSGNYTYLWTTLDGQGLDNSNLNQTGLSAGTYKLDVTDVGRGSCVFDTSYVVINENELVISGSVKDVTCNGNSDGAITNISISDASPVVIYTWSGPNGFSSSSNEITGVEGGTYQLDVLDGNSCAATETFLVDESDLITFDLEYLVENCEPYKRGVNLNNLVGGTGDVNNYQFFWSGPGNVHYITRNLTGLTVGGVYTVTVKDENNCEVTQSIIIPEEVVITETVTELKCNGANNGAISIDITGGVGAFTYQWFKDNNPYANTKNIDNLDAATYKLVVIDAGESDGSQCTFTKDIVLSEPSSISIIDAVKHISCNGDADGQILLSITGGTGNYSYNWSSGNGTGLVPTAKDQSNLSGGTYTVVVTDDNGCSVSSDFTVLEPEAIGFNLTLVDTQCDGTAGEIHIVDVEGGSGAYNYTWAGPGIEPADQGTKDVTDLIAGDYTVTVWDAGIGHESCHLTKTVTLTSAIDLTYSVVPETCDGQGDGAITIDVQGGQSGYTYVWTTADGSGIVADAQNQAGLTEGTYNVTITDTRGCFITQEILVARNNVINVVGAVTDVLCYGDNTGEIALIVSGGSGNYNFHWTGTGIVDGIKDQTDLSTGSYTVLVTDNVFGCEVTQTYDVRSPVAPVVVTVDSITDVLCKGNATGAIYTSVTGGTVFDPSGSPYYKYQWSGPGVLTSSQDQINLIAGDYNVTVADANGCFIVSDIVAVSEPAEALTVSVTDVVDVTTFDGNDGEIEIAVSGGTGAYNIDWSGTDLAGNSVVGLTDDINRQTNLVAGNYNVDITDGNGCSVSLTDIFVNQPGGVFQMVVTTQNIIPCQGDNNGQINVNVTGGTLPYTITWFDASNNQLGQIVANGVTIDNLSAGVYRVDVTDANSVTISRNDIVITEPTELQLSALIARHVDCYDSQTGVITLQANGGVVDASNHYRIEVTGPNGYRDVRTDITEANNFIYNSLVSGVYNIRLTDDSNGDDVFDVNDDCVVERALRINQPEAKVTVSLDSEICIGESTQIKFVVDNWTDIAANNLTVTLSDGSVVVLNESPHLHTVNPVDNTVYTITGVSIGSCEKGYGEGIATVVVNPLPTARIYSDEEICFGETATLFVDLTGSGPWTVTWTDGTTSTVVTGIAVTPFSFDITPNDTTVYKVLDVQDLHCSNIGIDSVVVTVNDRADVTISGNADICYGLSTDISLNFSAGTAPYDVTLTENGVNKTLTGIIPDASGNYIYTVTPNDTTEYILQSVTDAKGCAQVVSGSVVVTVRPYPEEPGAITGDDLVCQGATGISYSVDEVKFATNYVWSMPAGATVVSGGGSNVVTVNFDNSYAGGTMRVYAENGCAESARTDMLINVNPLPDAAGVVVGSTNLCQASTGVMYSVSTITNAIGYAWTLPAGFNIVSGDGTSSIIVNLNPTIANLTGVVSVEGVNDCGNGLPSPDCDVTVTPLPTAFAGHDEEICTDTYNLQADVVPGGQKGTWTILNGSGVIQPTEINLPNATVTNLSQGENIFVWRVEVTAPHTGCSAADTVTIINNQLTVIADVEERVTCDGVAVVDGTPVPTGADGGMWTFLTGNGAIVDAVNSTTQVVNLDFEQNVLQWTVTKHGCQSSAQVEIINNQPDQAVISNGDYMDVCTDKVVLSSNAPTVAGAEGLWTLVSGAGVIDHPKQTTINVTGLAKGDNVLHWTIEKSGCFTTDEIVVRNNQLDVDAGADRTLCDESFNLNATTPPVGVTGRWIVTEGTGTFDDGFIHDATVSGLAKGINRLTWELNQKGCISTDVITLTNNEPTQATTGAQLVVCADTVQLIGNTPVVGAGFWSVVSGSGRFGSDVNNSNVVVYDIQEGINVYRWTITNNGCSSYADQKVENMKVYVSAGKDTSICERTTVLDGNNPISGYGEWNIVPGMGSATFEDITKPNTRIGGLDYGNNVFVWTVNNSTCVSRDTVVITNNSPYIADAGTDQMLPIGSTSTHLNATVASIGIGSWSLISGGADIINPLNAHTEINDIRRGPNEFRWTVEHLGCVSVDEVIITNGEVIDANAGINQTICDNWTYLQANDPDVGIGEWSVVSGSGKLESPHNQKSRVYDLGAGENVFRWTIYYTNSSSSDIVTITNNQVSVAKAGSNRDLCGDTFTLEANVPAIGDAKWTVISGGGVFDDNTNPNAEISGLTQGANVLKYEISQLGCSSIDSVTIYNNVPTIANAGLDQTICTDSFELHPNTPTFGVGEWRVEEGSAQFEGNWAKELAPGNNKLIWVITSHSCVSSDTLQIQNNQPSAAFAGHDRIVCVDSVSLSANKPQYGVGEWEFISGSGDIEDVTDSYSKVTGLSRGGNRFRWVIDNNGCISSDDVEISNNLIPAIAGANQINCADTAVLEANLPSPGDGIWGVVGGSGSAIFEDTSDPYTVVRGLNQGENKLTWTINYMGCSAVSEVIIRNDNPTKAFAGENIGLCVNSTELSANEPIVGAGAWTLVNGGGKFVDETVPQTRINNLKFGDNLLRWTITYNTCVSYDDVEVSFNRIDATAGADLITCSTDTVLEANSGLPGIGTWSVVGGGENQAVFADQNDPRSRVYNLAQGDNLLRWSVSYRGCDTFDEINVVNNSPSTSYAGNSQELCEDNTVLDATSVIVGQGYWEILTGAASIADPNDPKTQISELSKGDNVFRWTVMHEGCMSADEVLITNNRPSEPYAGHDMDICYSNTVLKADPPEHGTGSWSIIQGAGNFSNPTVPNAQVENLAPGVNILMWTLIKGQCVLFDSIVITNNKPTIANAGPDIQDCKDWSELDANVPSYGVGEWTVVSGKGDFDDANDPKTTIRNLGFGENILMWTVRNVDCFSTDQVVVFNQVPDPSDAGSDRTICDDYVVLNANNPVAGTGTWSVISGAGDFEDSSLFNTKVVNVGFGKNVYKWTIAYAGSGCFTESTMSVTSNKAVPFAGDDETVYKPEYQMQAANPGAIQATWSVVAGNGDFDDLNHFSTIVRNLAAGKNTFRWSIDVDGCGAYDDVTIWYKEVPDAGFEVDKENGCYPLDVKFTNYSVGGDQFYWDFGDGSTSNVRHPKHTYIKAGEFTVILTIPGPDGKDAVYSKLIVVYDHPVAEFDVKPTVVYVPRDFIRLYDFSVDAESYLWNFGDGTTSEESSPSHGYVDEGIYSIQLTVHNEFGCEDVMLKEDVVEAKMIGFISFPNSFMPRPDDNVNSVNAIFKPAYRDVDSYTVQIFNRWGQLIFESNDIDIGWDGMYKGQLAPQAVYVWKVSGTYVSGKEFRKTGSVLLVR